ncbi:hypothetical protein GGR58DRAFT_167799 [Xylaria digitata]|nr:hypothetical protein GGR58DRAFT_167799 [Xylaria digitata]
MSLTAAARRLLRALSLCQSAAAMIDLQRGHLTRPAIDGWWCAIRCAIDRAGTADSCSTTACVVELELWPCQPSISRRPSRSSFSSLSSAGQYDDDDDDFYNDQYHPAATSRGLGQRDSGRLCIDIFSSHPHTLNDSKTFPSPPNSLLRPIDRTDSFDSIASGASTSSLSDSRANNEGTELRNRRSKHITGAPPIRVWSDAPTTRQQTESSITKSSAKRRSSDETSQACWRGYWG